MRLLVKAKAGPKALKLNSEGISATGSLLPLTPSIDEGAAMSWRAVSLVDVKGRPAPWDVCHALMRDGLGVAGGDVRIAEPDLEQSWIPPSEKAKPFVGVRSEDCAKADAQNKAYPPLSEKDWAADGDYWFATDTRTGLASARRLLGEAKPSVRIAHLDTGYDPNHETKPAHLRKELARNFADAENGKPKMGAIDDRTAEVNPMFGHGTATLAILAGEKYGGARGFEVAPIRVANWVVLFKNSAIAAALDYVHQLYDRGEDRCLVVSMSMGGLPSAAWADAINALYEKGIVVVTAAGNNFGNLPARSIVYPARFNRVLAACGVMADGAPYADLAAMLMAGCYGPTSKMRTALSAWTPNMPWARFGCPSIIDQDGGGTSSATPQIAAAAALWLERHKEALKGYDGWRRVEAVRRALFDSAARAGAAPDEKLGRGVLRAFDALALAPAPLDSLRKEADDSVDFALLKLLFGAGVTESPRHKMLELEACQLSMRHASIEQALDGRDPSDMRLSDGAWDKVLTALADAPDCSQTLKSAILERLPASVSGTKQTSPAPAKRPAVPSSTLAPPKPFGRRLRVFAFDPGFSTNMATRRIAVATIHVDWEGGLRPGPIGEYLEVIDVDPASNRVYDPANLNEPEILAQDGLEPSEGVPQSHQQMVYAVAMKTIGHFRTALGRAPFWAERLINPQNRPSDRRFVRRLRIYPHALREANAYYSPDRRALLFGYFRAASPGSVETMRGGMIFTCLSHDIVAHETTHALLDGLHPRWKEASHEDTSAFHEAFADLVALFQHFSMPEALLAEIRRAQGKLRFGAMMADLARQFGQAVGEHRALRSAIGRRPTAEDYVKADGPHALGEVLVAAVFDAWIQVYEDRTADLFRLASNGTGVLPRGDIPYDLATRLAEEAAKLARHFLNIVIRALDYCPPVDLTFGEYLRAMITADADLVPEDPRGYRVALVDGFRKRGIFPEKATTWSPASLVWEAALVGPATSALSALSETINTLAKGWRINSDRLAAWRSSRNDARTLHGAISRSKQRDAILSLLRLYPPNSALTLDGRQGITGGVEVHSVRPLRRVGPDGQVVSDVVIEITQGWSIGNSDPTVRGGCTIIWDRTEQRVRYLIYKRLDRSLKPSRRGDLGMGATESAARHVYYSDDQDLGEPFAVMHSSH